MRPELALHERSMICQDWLSLIAAMDAASVGTDN